MARLPDLRSVVEVDKLVDLLTCAVVACRSAAKAALSSEPYDPGLSLAALQAIVEWQIGRLVDFGQQSSA